MQSNLRAVVTNLCSHMPLVLLRETTTVLQGDGLYLNKLREDVCHSGSKGVEQNQHPEVEDGRMLSQKPVPPHLVTAKGLHDL